MEFDSQSFLTELASLMEERSLSLDTSLYDLEGWDSLGVTSMIMFVDRKFKLVLSPDAIGECQTVGDLQALVMNQCKRAA